MNTTEAIAAMRDGARNLISRDHAGAIVSAFGYSLADLGLAAQIYGIQDRCLNYEGQPGFAMEEIAVAIVLKRELLSASEARNTPYGGRGKSAEFIVNHCCDAIEQHLAA